MALDHSSQLQINSIATVETHGGATATITLGEKQFRLNESSLFLWKLIEEQQSVGQILATVRTHYENIDHVSEQEIRSILETFVMDKLVLIQENSKNDAQNPTDLSGRSIKLERFVDYYVPTPDLMWSLEEIRQTVIGILSIYPDKPSAQHVDLSETGLAEAINLDLDTAGQNKTSQVQPYRNLVQSKGFQQKSEIVTNEISKLLSLDSAPLVLRGQAYYTSTKSMGWHSNYKAPGLRVYCSWASEEKKNFFRYKHPESGHIITEWEPAGWTIKAFYIPGGEERLWHCIHCGSERFALGYGIMD